MFKYISLITLLLSSSVEAKQTYGNAVVSEVVSIYDGDTFRVNINGYSDIIGKNIPIRLIGVDAPEMRGKCKLEKELARAAKQFTVAKLRAAKKVELRNMMRGKYFRIAADVYVDGRSLGQMLIDQGHAVKYSGGKKTKDWCS